MPTTDKRIDAYIMKSAPFAQPILEHLRALVHKACPEVEETMKWSFPHFDYKGEMMCSMAAFKNHCAFGFWKASLMKDSSKLSAKNKEAMGHMGKITSLSDLPSGKVLIAYIKEAMRLTDKGVKVPARTKSAAPIKLMVPAYFKEALNKNKHAQTVFENFSPSHKKEYVQWITEAKREDTRKRRVVTAIEWLAQGKIRDWKYQKK